MKTMAPVGLPGRLPQHITIIKAYPVEYWSMVFDWRVVIKCHKGKLEGFWPGGWLIMIKPVQNDK
jgi:hypothetical protein